MWDAQTPKSQELEELCQMFPPISPNTAENMLLQAGNEYFPYGYDDFNGLMDMHLPSFNGVLLDTRSSNGNSNRIRRDRAAG